MSILILVCGIALLLILITYFRLSAFLALIITAFAVGLMKQMPLDVLAKSVTTGIGGTLGGVILVIGFGVMLGSMLSEVGAAQQISDSLIRIFGVKRAKIAICITGFVVGLAMFYNAGFVILIPLAFSVAARTGLPLIYLGVAMAAPLSVTHGFLPPHPGATAVVNVLGANMGKTLLLGLVAAVPSIIVAGIIFPEFLRKIAANPPQGLVEVRNMPENELPSFIISLLVALSPVLLMAAATIAELTLPHEHALLPYLKFLGDPSVSMLIAVVLGLLFWANPFSKDKTQMETLMNKSNTALGAVVTIFLIVGAGGAFKQVLTDSGIGKDIAALASGFGFPPLILAWLVATIVRVSIGSATVAGLMAAGIVFPLVKDDPSVSKELIALSIGAGSLMFSHVNDSGFWIFKEYFGLSLTDTFKTWTVMETIVGVVGLVMVLVMSVFM
jgi:gluconate transporter